ncbi:diaminobutyrate--2-oxoglutarate transaminase [Methyloligella solikamskensis]|uniref:Diaminobutyrate--2-oxoglutarate transaminase n=1 Tax=Methyloligella solikamskensis TaxID=1177756 RepID=A0ABW3JDZ0_9HYPH
MTETPNPSPDKPNTDIYERRESIVRSYSRAIPREFDKAQDVWMYDEQGGRYLDFLAGCSSLNYGHNHPVMKKALLEYIERDGVAHAMDLHTKAKNEFLEAYEEIILKPRNMDHRVMFTGPTGTNAVEAAIKLARKVTERSQIIAFTNGFHGMTLGALAATGNVKKRAGAGVSLGDVSHEPYDGYFGPDVDTAEQLDHRLSDPSSGLDKPAAIILETVQGEGGLNACSDEWLRKIADIAKKHGALLIVDDIQAGCGRMGSYFSFEESGINPDIITQAKSLSGYGLPFAVALIKPELDIWSPAEHNGTFRGNNHAFVTATAAFKEFWTNDKLVNDVKRRDKIMKDRLEAIAQKHGLETRGRGMMRGVAMENGELAGAVTQKCFERGLIIETSGADSEVVKILVALVIDDENLKTGLDIIEESVDEVLGGPVKVAAE